MPEPLRRVPDVTDDVTPHDDNRGESRYMRITIPVDCKLGAGAMWFAAVTLMALDTIFGGSTGIFGRWSILTGIGAAAWSVCMFVGHSRRVILEVISWEHWRQENGPDEPEREGLRALR